MKESRYNNPILATLLWQFSVLRKISVVSPGHTTMAIGISILARLSLLLSFLLPFKAIIFAGGDRVPGFVLQVLPSIEREWFIFSLGITAMTFYLIYMISERGITPILDKGAARITERANKISAHFNVYEQTRSLYKQICKSQSALVLAVILCIVLFIIYTKLFVILVSVILVPWVVITLLVNNSMRSKDWIYRNRGILMQRSLFIALMICLVTILFDILSEDPPSVIISIVGFIVSRQALNYVLEYIKIVIALRSQREKISNLLFYDSKFYRDAVAYDKGKWPDLTTETAERVCVTALDAVGISCNDVTIRWCNCNIYDVLPFNIIPASPDTDAGEQYFVKVYNTRLHPTAVHEETLLGREYNTEFPAPKFLGRVTASDYECIVMECPGQAIDEVSIYNDRMLDLLIEIWSVHVPPTLSLALQRSTPCRIHALNLDIIEKLFLMVTDQQQHEDLCAFMGLFQKIISIALSLPMVLHNPEISINSVAVRQDGSLNVIYWGRWSLEPVGTALWYFNKYNNTDLERAIVRLSMVRQDCKELIPEHLRLAGALYYFSRLYGGQKYLQAIQSVREILRCYAAVSGDIRETAQC